MTGGNLSHIMAQRRRRKAGLDKPKPRTKHQCKVFEVVNERRIKRRIKQINKWIKKTKEEHIMSKQICECCGNATKELYKTYRLEAYDEETGSNTIGSSWECKKCVNFTPEEYYIKSLEVRKAKNYKDDIVIMSKEMENELWNEDDDKL